MSRYNLVYEKHEISHLLHRDVWNLVKATIMEAIKDQIKLNRTLYYPL